jgi:hypothetical protein
MHLYVYVYAYVYKRCNSVYEVASKFSYNIVENVCYSHFHNDSFFFWMKKTQDQILEPKRTGSVFVLSVQYEYSFFCATQKNNHYGSQSTTVFMFLTHCFCCFFN